MTYMEIATVSYFTNIPKGYRPTDEEAEAAFSCEGYSPACKELQGSVA